MQEQQYTGVPYTQGYGADNGMGMGNNSGGGIVRFLLGLFTGIAVATPVTALIVKKVCDKDKEQAVARASILAENRGIQAMAEVYKEEVTKGAGGANLGHFEPSRGIPEAHIQSSGVSESSEAEKTDQKADSEGSVTFPVYLEGEQMRMNLDDTDGDKFVAQKGVPYNEAYLASLQSPPDDSGSDDDIENYDLRIDDEEATADAREFSEQHVKYLDMIDRYKNQGGNIPPMTISREQFENEHFYEKSYVNWYEDDDVFAEDEARIEDPYYTFGFLSGHEMFAPERVAVREDPDICHIRNMHQSTDYEITRMHGSYQEMVVDGGEYYRGEAASLY